MTRSGRSMIDDGLGPEASLRIAKRKDGSGVANAEVRPPMRDGTVKNGG